MNNVSYQNISCSPHYLDIFYIKHSLIIALKRNLNQLEGTLLDVGCGYMPYKSLLLSSDSKVTKYIRIDLNNNPIYHTQPDLIWDGKYIPLENETIDSVIATEVFEHCSLPELVMKEIWRVLKPNGLIFLTVPFLWPLHDVPYDEYRYTPFSLERHLENAGFKNINLKALGGWDASLAQMIGLWVRRRFQNSCKQKLIRELLSILITPIIWFLIKLDKPPQVFQESSMITGLYGTATKSC